MLTRGKIILVSVAVAIGALYGADRLLCRKGRLRHAAECSRLKNVKDAILCFKLDHERLPAKLSELTPGYIAAQELYCEGKGGDDAISLSWDPSTGVLEWPVPFPVTGLLPRKLPVELTVPNPKVQYDAIAGQTFFGDPQEAIELGDEDVVVEAEQFCAHTYGWDIGRGQGASAGAYIWLKESRGDLDHELREFRSSRRSGDFYNIGSDCRRIEATCEFNVPESGYYTPFVRTMAHKSKCSNIIYVSFNGGYDRFIGHKGTTPFAWRWHRPNRVNRVYFKKGRNRVSFHTYQDGVKVDQIVLSRNRWLVRYGSSDIYKARDGGTGFQDCRHGPLTLSLSCDTLTVREGVVPAVDIYVRRNRKEPTAALLVVEQDVPSGPPHKRTRRIMLPGPEPLHGFNHPVELPEPVRKKEYLVRATVRSEEGTVLDERTVVLLKPFDWWIVGPVLYIPLGVSERPQGYSGPGYRYRLDGQEHRWRKFDVDAFNHFAQMDFIKFFRTSKAPMSDVCVFAYTEVWAEEGGNYMVKAQADDNMVLWINDECVLMINEPAEDSTAIRTAVEKMVKLRPGRNTVMFRLNQRADEWLASIRFRTPDGSLARVHGIPYREQGQGARN